VVTAPEDGADGCGDSVAAADGDQRGSSAENGASPWICNRAGGYGLIGDIVLRIMGAFIGESLFGFLMPGVTVGVIGSIVVAFIGAVVLIAVSRAVSTRRGVGWR
jgi:uncharacterized membrane protein YeaQ/YmgE (transglycosylase-associated protein family)